MTIEEAMVRKLEQVLNDVIGNRIYPDAGPQSDGQDEPPPCFLAYQHAGDDNLTFLSGGRSSTRIDTYILELRGPDRGIIERARDVIYEAFAGANCTGWWGGPGPTRDADGVIVADPDRGIWVQGAFATDATADADPPAQGDEELDRAERLSLRIIWTKPEA